MRVLIIGSGGREHAMARALRSDAATEIELFIAPGNPGTEALGRNVAVAAGDVAGLVELVRRERIELVIPGPELPLCAGLADALARLPGVLCCGPSAAAAQLEGSKLFTRQLTGPLGVPGPRFEVVRSAAELDAALDRFASPPVLKADGLCAGKGVLLPPTLADCRRLGRELLDGRLGTAGRTLVLEERLVGSEASLFYACHGEQLLALPHARDYKRASDGDTGPNTGGMGAQSPNPAVTPALCDEVTQRIVRPTLRALAQRGTPFVGFLFVGLMLTAAGPQLLEFNVRLGDPEAQAILPRLGDGEFLRLCLAVAGGRLHELELRPSAGPTCAVVLAASGYPDAPMLGSTLEVAEKLATAGRWFVHAGTARHGGQLTVSGGRVGAVVAQAATAEAARQLAYDGLAGITCLAGPPLIFRRDIGSADNDAGPTLPAEREHA